MTSVKVRQFELLTFLALFCMLISLTILFLWIRAFNLGASQPERVQIYLSYFPAFLGLARVTVINVVFCISAIVLSTICLRQGAFRWKILNIVIFSGSALLLLLILFGML